MDLSRQEELLKSLASGECPEPDQFKQLVLSLDTHHILAKVFLLEGTPSVFSGSPMKYVIFREQVADQFGIGSQDVCIVGSARLGFSPSPSKFGTPFKETSDVDVVVVSEELFHRGSQELFSCLSRLPPQLTEVWSFADRRRPVDAGKTPPVVPLENWKSVKEAMRNFAYGNLNPGLFPQEHPLRKEIFDAIGSTAGLFLALEPKVFVSKIRCRVFRTWRAVEDYYANSLRDAKRQLSSGRASEPDFDDDDGSESLPEPDACEQQP